ncbi:MAG: hypothetical protein EAX86_04985 [Candidatus Heimdallarchaeota archaeon]|nr:hypothetical protein [Candidatus Heimdallarchaeota archaeon]
MTSLDNFISLIKPGKRYISIVQNSPSNLLVVVNEEQFQFYLQSLKRWHFTFRFLEQRNYGIDIHSSIDYIDRRINLTFRLVNCTRNFLVTLGERFPSMRVFIENLRF